MNLRQLQIFAKVAETGSMSETARQLFMTQPAVSQTILDLEERLQVKLFDRINRKLILSDAGDVLHTYSKRILVLVEEAENTLRDFANLKTGRLRLGASTTIGIYLLPKIIGEFKRKHKEIETCFNIDNTGVIEQMILGHDIDLGLVEGFTHSKEIITTHLFDDELYLICSPQHRFAKQQQAVIDPQELAAEPLIHREPGSGTREIVEQALLQNQAPYQVTHVLNNTEAIKRAVEADIGIAFVSKLAVQEEIQAGRLVRIQLKGIRLTRTLNLIYHKDKYRSPLFESFVDHVTGCNA